MGITYKIPRNVRRATNKERVASLKEDKLTTLSDIEYIQTVRIIKYWK